LSPFFEKNKKKNKKVKSTLIDIVGWKFAPSSGVGIGWRLTQKGRFSQKT
jgi:hypothetical protein